MEARWARSGRRLGLYLALAVLLVVAYSAAAGLNDELGFPLDDAWIHQTYARNLGEHGRWEYLPGQVSAGSTAPLWTGILALGYWIGIPYRWWAGIMGAISLAATGWLAHRLVRCFLPESRWLPPLAGILCVSEWHLVWAAASGMETMLYAALLLALIERVHSAAWRQTTSSWGLAGLIAGALVLTRPEGVLLIGLLGLTVVWTAWRQTWPPSTVARHGLAFLGAMLLLLLPYLWFNLEVSGRLWPNTFYAKQTEYAALLAAGLLSRLWRVLLPPLTGFQVLLVPGLVVVAAKGARALMRLRAGETRGGDEASSRFLLAAPLAYLAAHLGLYALRLPVIYQHGRYLMPIIPLVIVLGLAGLEGWAWRAAGGRWRWVLGRSWLAAVLILAIAFLVIGGRTYARDVEIIQKEMVDVGRWLAAETDPDELVAAHDIGAIGFFSQRPILDLAGLISPEVVSVLGDEAALADHVLGSPAGYVVTAPGWPYELITQRQDVELLFQAESRWTRAAGLNSSAVYRLPEQE